MDIHDQYAGAKNIDPAKLGAQFANAAMQDIQPRQPTDIERHFEQLRAVLLRLETYNMEISARLNNWHPEPPASVNNNPNDGTTSIMHGSDTLRYLTDQLHHQADNLNSNFHRIKEILP